MKKNTNNLSKLFKYYKKYKFLSIMVIILSLGYAGISLLSPIYEGKMLGFFENFNKNQILNTALFLVILRIIIEIVTNIPINNNSTIRKRWIEIEKTLIQSNLLNLSFYRK